MEGAIGANSWLFGECAGRWGKLFERSVLESNGQHAQLFILQLSLLLRCAQREAFLRCRGFRLFAIENRSV